MNGVIVLKNLNDIFSAPLAITLVRVDIVFNKYFSLCDKMLFTAWKNVGLKFAGRLQSNSVWTTDGSCSSSFSPLPFGLDEREPSFCKDETPELPHRLLLIYEYNFLIVEPYSANISLIFWSNGFWVCFGPCYTSLRVDSRPRDSQHDTKSRTLWRQQTEILKIWLLVYYLCMVLYISIT